jgi:hypothetical protein
MTFDKPARTGGDYPDLKAETADGSRLVAVRVLDFLPPEDSDFVDRTTGQRNKIYPVLCDVMIIDGPHAGWIYRNWTARYAFTNGLRGASSSDPTPTTRPGQHLAIKAERPKKRGEASTTVYANEPTDDEVALIESEFVRFGGWDGPGIARDKVPATAGAPAPAASPAASAPAAAPQRPVPPAPAASAAPAQAAGSGARRPFGPRA